LNRSTDFPVLELEALPFCLGSNVEALVAWSTQKIRGSRSVSTKANGSISLLIHNHAVADAMETTLDTKMSLA
jgi:hypothetical protein